MTNYRRSLHYIKKKKKCKISYGFGSYVKFHTDSHRREGGGVIMQSGQVGRVNFPRLNTCSPLLSEDCIRNQDKVSKIL